jgi:hypothetical protein
MSKIVSSLKFNKASKLLLNDSFEFDENLLILGPSGYNSTNDTSEIMLGNADNYIKSIFEQGVLLGATHLSFETIGTKRMVIDNIGNIGIGTDSPGYKLDINGVLNIRSGNTIKINGVDVLSSTTLGSGIVNSSLTSVGSLTSLNVAGAITGQTLGVSGTSIFTGGITSSAIDNSGAISTQTLGVSGTSIFTGGITSSAIDNSGAISTQTLGVSGTSIFTGGITSSAISNSGAIGTQTLGVSGTSIFTGGITSSAIDNSGAIGTQTLGVSGTSIFTGDITSSAISNSGAISTQTLGVSGTSIFTGGITSSAISNSGAISTQTLYSSGNVGIGTATPAYKLEVEGDCKVKNVLYVGDDGAVSTIKMGGGAAGDSGYETSVIESRLYGATENTELVLFKGNDIGANSDRIRLRANSIHFDTYSVSSNDRTVESIRMTIDQNGNVGIGTTAPDAKLTIYGGSNPKLHIINTAENDAGIKFSDSGDIPNQNFEILYNSATEALRIRSDDNDNIMFFSPTGNVGIGTAVKIISTDDLTIKPNDTIGRVSIGNSGSSYLTYGININAGFLYSTGTLDINGSIYMSASNGNIGIGTITPAYKLDVNGVINVRSGSDYKLNGVSVLSSTTLGSGIVNSSLTSVGTLTSVNVSGNVGIGTVVPAYKLDVIGDMSVSDAILIGTTLHVIGNASIEGNLYVSGDTFSIESQTLTVVDSMISLASNNNSDIVDSGFYSTYNDGVQKYTGLVRDSTDGNYHLFDGSTAEPGTTQMTLLSGITGYSNLQLNGIELESDLSFNGSLMNIKSGGLAGSTALSINSNGNVGIGTVNLSATDIRLHLYYASHNRVIIETGGGTSTECSIDFKRSDTLWKIGMDNSGSGDTDNFIFKRVNNSSSQLCISTAGNVGIGTDTPGQKLDVIGNISVPIEKGIMFAGPSDFSWAIYIADDGAGNSISGGNAVASPLFTQHALRFRSNADVSNGFIFENDAEELLASIQATTGNAYFKGSVGIGTSTLTSKLNVESSGTGVVSLKSTSTVAGPHLYFNDFNDNTASFAWIGDGSSGTGARDNALEIGVTGRINFTTTNNPTNPEMTILNNGNVGIGVTAPTEKLEISGNLSLINPSDNKLNYKARYIETLGNPNEGTFTGYLLLAKKHTNPNTATRLSASYVIGKVHFYRGSATHGFNTTTLDIYSSRGYEREMFLVSMVRHSERAFYNRQVYCTYNGVVYHAIETISTGGSPREETSFYGVTKDSPLIYVDSTYVSSVVAFGTLGTITNENGNVGIGTTAPTAKLHISSGTSGDCTVIIEADTDNSNEEDHPSLIFKQDGGAVRGEIGLDTTLLESGINNGIDNSFYFNSYAHIVLATVNEMRMVINNVGNVGIGTNNPGNKLTVTAGHIAIDNTFGLLFNGTSTHHAIYLQTSATANGSLDGVGNAPSDANVSLWAVRFRCAKIATEGFMFENNNEESLMSINSNTGNTYIRGRVGVRTASPATDLHVLGDGTTSVADTGLRIENTSADATAKQGRIKTGHYTNAEEPVTTMISEMGLTTNRLFIGGGSSTENNMTEIQFHTAATTTTVGANLSMVINSAGNVGIGTNNPDEKLTIYGSANPKLHIINTAEDDAGIKFSDSAAISTQNFEILFNSSGQTLRFRSDDIDNIMYLHPAGNVGIGTSTLTSKLNVESSGFNLLTLKSTSTVAGPQLHFNDFNGNLATIMWIGDGSAGTGARDSALEILTTSGRINFTTTNNVGNPEMTILNNGNVGIGTATPAYKLEVEGDCKVKSVLYVGDDGAVSTIKMGGGAAGDATYETAVIESRLYGAGEQTELVLFKGNDTGANSDRIRLRANSIHFDTYSAATNDRVAESIRMTIDQNGNVGIGVTSPATDLHIVGDTGLRIENTSANTTSKQGSIKTGHYANAEEPVTILISSTTFTDNSLLIGGGSGSENNMTDIQFHTTANITTVGANLSMIINRFGNVGIGTDSPSVALDVIGDIEYTGTITDVSDYRIKTGITNVDTSIALDIINNIPLKRFEFNDIYCHSVKNTCSNSEQYGFIAQDVYTQLPEAVRIDSTPNEFTTYNSHELSNAFYIIEDTVLGITFSNHGLVTNDIIIIKKSLPELNLNENTNKIITVIDSDNISITITGGITDNVGEIPQILFDTIDETILIPDLHHLNRMRIHDVSVGAIQELFKRIQTQQTTIESLIQRITALENA